MALAGALGDHSRADLAVRAAVGVGIAAWWKPLFGMSLRAWAGPNLNRGHRRSITRLTVGALPLQGDPAMRGDRLGPSGLPREELVQAGFQAGRP